MIKVVLDTNVYVSAIVFGGIPRNMFFLAQKEFELFYSPAIFAEAVRIFTQKFKLSKTDILDFKSYLEAHANLVVPVIDLKVIDEDPDDDRILECAVTARANVIVSGDKDLLWRRRFRKITIVSPGEFNVQYLSV